MQTFTSQDNFQISNIITNPPYNNDTYIPFIELSHTITTNSTVAITPAKWQAKDDENNANFRNTIVSYMNNIVFYKDSLDIFDIYEWGGICYYMLNKTKSNKKYIKNVCNRNNTFQSNWEEHSELKLNLYNNRILKILEKVNTLTNNTKTIDNMIEIKRYVYTSEQDMGNAKSSTNIIELMQGDKVVGYKAEYDLFTTINLDKYKCICSIMTGGALTPDENGKVLGVPKIHYIKPNQVPKGSFPILCYFDTENECKSFISYINTKLIAFLHYIGVCGTTVTKSFFRFIPIPEAFDHIFTDNELYAKYNISQDEISMIESTIKPRT